MEHKLLSLVSEVREQRDAYRCLCDEMAEVLDSIWFSEFGSSVNCVEGEQIKEVLSKYEAVRRQESPANSGE